LPEVDAERRQKARPDPNPAHYELAPSVPEPASYLMLALGLGVLGLRRARAQRA